MNNKNKEIQVLDTQIWATFGFLIATIISIFLSYNQKLKKQNIKPIISRNQEVDLIIFNRLFTLLLVIIFLYVNLETYDIAKSKNHKLNLEIEQIIAGSVTVIAALLAMDVSLKDINNQNQNSETDFENPIL